MHLTAEAREDTCLLLAPVGQDAALVAKVLADSGIRSMICRDLNELCGNLKTPFGAIFVAEEALTPEGVGLLNSALADQPPWSDIPIILATGGSGWSEVAGRAWRDFAVAGNVTLLERPMRMAILTSAVHVALRARRRQYLVRRLLQEQLDATRIREEFISMASHELKNPISSLKLQIQLNRRLIARSGPDAVSPDRLRKLIDTTERISERLNRLVDDMLDVSRIQAGRLHLELREMDFTSMIEEISERFLPLFAATGNALRVDLEQGIEGLWDPFRLEQVLSNLFTNAQRYAPGSPLSLTARKRSGRIEVRLADQGPGIAKEHLERIFRRFERAEEVHRVSGLGLGLFICREIIEAHGGTIRAESEPGRGATFIIDLPERASAPRSAEKPQIQAGTSGAFSEGSPGTRASA